MTGAQKLKNALNHKSGKVPFDLGGTAVTGVHCSVAEQLRDYYGLKKQPISITDPYQMLGKVDNDLKEAMGVDTEGITGDGTIFGFILGEEKEWVTPWGQTVLVPKDFNVTVDSDDTTYIYPCGDLGSAPCAKMPKSGYFFDTIVRGHNFDEDAPNVQDNLEEFSLINQNTRDYFQTSLVEKKRTGRGIIASAVGTAIGDIALVPAPMLKNPKGLRDISEWYMATLTNTDYLHEIFEKQTEIAIENLKTTHEIFKDDISAIFICGTDFGTQNAQFCSNETFRSLYMPYYKKINGWIHSNTTWKTFKHSCGSIFPLLPEIIESGFDIINPVQWSADNMDAQKLKTEFGKDLTFWGGGINTQKTLPFGTPGEVREEVLRCLDTFSTDGGFVFNTIHNIQAKTPIDNIIAMVDALKEFNGEN